MITCYSCNDPTPIQESTPYQDGNLCPNCVEQGYETCQSCDALIHHEDATEGVSGDPYCRSCWDAEFFYCPNCDDVTRHDDGCMTPNDEAWCPDCYSEYCARCAGCDYVCWREDICYHEGQDADYCEDCYPNGPIWQYEYKPYPQFYGKTLPFFGIELEVEAPDAADLDEDAKVLESAGHGLWYLKSDGSLNYGFEVVTHPIDWEWIGTNFRRFDPVFELRAHGYRSYDPGTCGMHVHLCKSVFDTLPLYKLLHLIYAYPEFSVLLSRRSSNSQYNYASLSLEPERRKELAKQKHSQFTRNYAFNLTHKTVEVRLFRGTLNPSSFRRNLECCHAFWQYGLNAQLSDVSPNHFADFVATSPEYPNLNQYLQENRDVYCDLQAQRPEPLD